ncbi:hypothetical protein SAMN05216343_102171 [Oscillibacter sp. PC13]|uniref:hypothetical protein n=1 Tax=Oscillibacter sp. PC13 TaxID=1855299 RepID=UPI0008E8B1A8|nr:hypothetical protein [Oscillibacter sp. PC13]SFP05815.1 hypothetical protein SAMN05216343_102171 [Oscillibacter sp. PC13]
MRKKQRTLLERIWQEVECPYLSDLRLHWYLGERIAQVVRQIPAGDFSADEWREAFCYLTGEQTDCRESQALRRKLLERMQEKILT